MTSVAARFWDKVEKTDTCWLWRAARSQGGYGRFGISPNEIVMAHRFAFAEARGSIPAGMTLDHLCRVRNCVNPDHLEPVTLRENILRGTSPIAAQARRMTCAQGHPLTPSHNGSKRRCLPCSNAYMRVYKARRRRLAREIEQ